MYLAPFASWSAVQRDVTEHSGANDFAQVLAAAPSVQQQIAALQDNMILQGTLPSIEAASVDRAVCQARTQSQLLSHFHKSTLRNLVANMNDDERAVLRSASGQGACAFLETPLDDRFVMTNTRFTIACMRRLADKWPAHEDKPQVPPMCANTTMNGRVCGQQPDALGKHQECCAPGGGLMIRHDNMVRCLASLAATTIDPRARTEQIIPELARPVEGQIDTARLDVIIHDGISRSLIDVVIVSPLAGGAAHRRACARRDGHAARHAECTKRTRYPTADLVPFALETGGRIGNSARAFVIRMAEATERPATERLRLYRAISSTLQDGVARQLEKRP